MVIETCVATRVRETFKQVWAGIGSSNRMTPKEIQRVLKMNGWMSALFFIDLLINKVEICDQLETRQLSTGVLHTRRPVQPFEILEEEKKAAGVLTGLTKKDQR